MTGKDDISGSISNMYPFSTTSPTQLPLCEKSGFFHRNNRNHSHFAFGPELNAVLIVQLILTACLLLISFPIVVIRLKNKPMILRMQKVYVSES